MQDTINSVIVTRGAQSMAFFAFIFLALFSLFAAILNDLHDLRPFHQPWRRTVVKVLLFGVWFLVVMISAWTRNWLSAHVVPGLTKENYPPVTMAFFMFTFSAVFALSNAVLNDYFLRKFWVRTVLRLVGFFGLFIFVVNRSWVHPILAGFLEWLRIERY